MSKALVTSMASAMLLAACAPHAKGDATPNQPAASPCQNAVAARYVGRPFTAELASEAKTATGAQLVRVLRPGDMATKDFRQDRLTINLDASDVIASARCV